MTEPTSIESARTFLRAHHHGAMATTRADGRTQMSPVTPDVDEDGFVVVSTRETARGLIEYYRRSRASIPTGTTTGPRWSATSGGDLDVTRGGGTVLSASFHAVHAPGVSRGGSDGVA